MAFTNGLPTSIIDIACIFEVHQVKGLDGPRNGKQELLILGLMLVALASVAIAPRLKFGAWVLLDGDSASKAPFEQCVECFDSVSGQFYSCTKDGLVEHVSGFKENTIKSFTVFAHGHRVPVLG